MRGKECIGRRLRQFGADIACELGRTGVAKKRVLVQRRGYWVIPKYPGGLVLDSAVTLPVKLRPAASAMPRVAAAAGIAEPRSWSQTAGRPEHTGLAKPEQSVCPPHIAVSQEIYGVSGFGPDTRYAETETSKELRKTRKLLSSMGSEEDVEVHCMVARFTDSQRSV